MKTRAIPEFEFFVQEPASVEQSTDWPLSSNQLRIWFVEQLAEHTAVNNLYFGVRLTGHLDLAALDQSLRALVDRHEALRTTFDLRNGEPVQSPQELEEESRKIRRLQMVVSMVTQVIAQDSTLTVDEASEMVADTRKAALLMFPDKELAFDLIYWPRLQRLMRERYRMQ